MKTKKKWVKAYHSVIRNTAEKIIGPYCRLRYKVTIEKFKPDKKQPYLILMNHQTAFDQFFVGMAFKGPVYYVASEDLFSLGFISKLLSFLVAPIPIKKQTTDLNAIKTCVRVSKEGGTIALFPEGNRTYHGKTLYFKPSIVKLVRLLKLPVVIFKVEGGFGVHPRWSDVVRNGKMKVSLAAVIQPEEYTSLSDDDLYRTLCDYLYVDENLSLENFYHKKSAERIERFLYVCPHCGLTDFQSKNNLFWCKKCENKIQYLPNKRLTDTTGKNSSMFTDLGQWYDYQCNFIRNLDLSSYEKMPIDRYEAKIFKVILYKKKELLFSHGLLSLYGDRITINDITLSFDEISAVTVLGKNKVNIYYKDLVYQIKADSSFNGLKYVNIYHHYRNNKRGNNDEQFLGL